MIVKLSMSRIGCNIGGLSVNTLADDMVLLAPSWLLYNSLCGIAATDKVNSGIAKILLRGGARAICWDFESDAIPIFLSQYISDTDISVVLIFP